MPAYTAIMTSSDPKRRTDYYFQRRKVGSIRDNPKLLKIRQQFENACKDPQKHNRTVSAPSSVSLSGGVLLGELLNSRFSKTGEALLTKSTVDPGRRNSEGDLKTRRSTGSVSYENAHVESDLRRDSRNWSSSSGNIHLSLTPSKYSLQTSSESGIHTGSSEEESARPLFASSGVDESTNRFFREVAPPPIPRRGISPAVHQIATLGAPKATAVQKTIEIYEGMSSHKKPLKSSLRLKREDSRRGSFLLRRNSRRNSLRSKHKDEQPPPKKSPIKEPEDDKAAEDRCAQSVYQTLSQVVSVSRESDPYDRLNRVHDVLNRIHKGQPSNCAACKAVPTSLLQATPASSSFMQVQCNELSPHHHPPCICFSCQHSVFSCTVVSGGAAEEDALYYNVCCLNAPGREGWRRSRRRPVCEQNGRLCIVNCDMEQRSSAAPTTMDEVGYEPVTAPQRDRSKLASGDSCDSDEGWVDVTDSEDERSLTVGRREPSIRSENRNPPRPTDLNLHNSSYDLDHIVTKCKDLDLSRAVSSEHLYESILDIDTQTEDNTKDLSQSSQGSVACSLKGDSTAENDLDSGEWSTESASPTFDESPTKEAPEPKASALNQYRFTVNYEAQETAKKTFMKSVLGGKKVSNSKKRSMSNFFVPWFANGPEYGLTKSPKGSLKKHSVHSQSSSKVAPCKNKRSQSVPSVIPKVSIACAKNVSSTDLFAKKDGETDELNNSLLNTDNTLSICSRVSDASSAYIRTDQVQGSETTKPKSPVSPSNVVECITERVRKRTPSGSSERTYIMFQAIKEDDVPLYQFYERNIKERVSFCRSPKSLSPVMWSTSSSSCYQAEVIPKAVASQPSVVEQLSPDASQDMKMLWCELPEVKESGILERISAQELKLQEAIFDFIQSEACYIRSLKVLYENFIKIPEFCEFESPNCVLSKHEHDVLFSDIVRVKEVSERLFGDLTTRWSDGILIPDICDIIHHNAALPSFTVYVRYCSNRVYQERTLRELKDTRLCFLEVLRKLESNPVCQGLSLESFLFLPMQHISRLPLLLDNIFRWLVPDSPSFGTCKTALEAVHKIFVQCNEGARKMERIEEMFVLNKLLEFKDCKVVPLISASRWLLKKGELMKLEFDKKTFGRSNRCVRVPIYLFLFNDLLIFTKRKSDDSYTVVDYCSREKIQAKPLNAQELQSPIVLPNTCRYLMYLTLSSNHQGASVDMIFNCSLLSERTRWLEAINGVQKRQSRLWEYDYPQVQCIRSYVAQQPDELSLQDSDVVSITRKMNDGWYEGRRLRDGLEGWFPVSFTMDIPCSRVRASNIRQCYRLLMLSQTQ